MKKYIILLCLCLALFVSGVVYAAIPSDLEPSSSVGEYVGSLQLKATKVSGFSYGLELEPGQKDVELLKFNLELRGSEGANLTWLGLRQVGFENKFTNIRAYYGNQKLGRTINNNDFLADVIDFYSLGQNFEKNTRNRIRIVGDVLSNAPQGPATLAFAGADFIGSDTDWVRSIAEITNAIESYIITANDTRLIKPVDPGDDFKDEFIEPPANPTDPVLPPVDPISPVNPIDPVLPPVYDDVYDDDDCDSDYPTSAVSVKDVALYNKLKGRIILKVEESGEAFYVHPTKRYMYYLCRPRHAFKIMREQGFGIATENLEKMPYGLSDLSGDDMDGDGLPNIFEDAIKTNRLIANSDGEGGSDRIDILSGVNPRGSGLLSDNINYSIPHSGKIFIQVEDNGEAWYVYPVDSIRYYLGRPRHAFTIMRNFGLGISDLEFNKMYFDN